MILQKPKQKIVTFSAFLYSHSTFIVIKKEKKSFLSIVFTRRNEHKRRWKIHLFVSNIIAILFLICYLFLFLRLFTVCLQTSHHQLN